MSRINKVFYCLYSHLCVHKTHQILNQHNNDTLTKKLKIFITGIVCRHTLGQ